MLRATTVDDFRAKLVEAQSVSGPVVVHVETDPLVNAPSSDSWWDVPVSETAVLDSTQQARKTYDEHKATQKLFL